MDSLEDKARPFEKETCRRIICLLMILSELVKSVLTDTHAESLFKTLTKAYKTLHTLVKYVSHSPLCLNKKTHLFYRKHLIHKKFLLILLQ